MHITCLLTETNSVHAFRARLSERTERSSDRRKMTLATGLQYGTLHLNLVFLLVISIAWRLKNNGCDPQKDQISTMNRRIQSSTFRLRTGHCALRKHLKRLGLADSAHCECGSEEQTPEHILQTCPHLETVRQQFWPEDTEVGTKLWGQAAELQRTADFLAATGLKM